MRAPATLPIFADFRRGVAPLRKRDKGFTLVELLVVVSVIALLLVFAVPAVAPIFRGSQLSVAADEVAGLLNTGHQAALASDRTVEVRFYQYANQENAGEILNDPTTWKFHALQLVQMSNQGVATPLNKPLVLPARVVIDSGPTLSPLLSGSSALPKTFNPPADPQVPIGTCGTSYNTFAFHFARDGSTNLPKSSNNFVTLLDVHDASTHSNPITTPPKNYATIQIDPYNGSVHLYRP